MILSINPTHPEPRKISKAVQVLEDGGVIAYPTGTVIGFGCDLYNKKAIENVYKIKGIQKSKPLSFLCSDLSNIAKYARVPDAAYRVMKRLIPGPYTFILEATKEVPRLVLHRKRKQVGIRVPDHPVAQALLQFPMRKPPDAREWYYWARIEVLGRPVFLLGQRLAAQEAGRSVVVDRQFYATQFVGAGQVFVGLLPVAEGTLAFFVDHTFVDRWTGFGVGAKRAIGLDVLDGVLEEVTERTGLCEGTSSP